MSLLRIAMWSGPRNISTAMMRAWENRPDTFVIDEPLYAHYLQTTGIDHPGKKHIMRSQSCDWKRITHHLTEHDVEGNYDIYYQKHMTHHLLSDMDLEWILSLENCFLIRDPDAVVASYAQKRPDLTIDDLGFSQQLALFNYTKRSGKKLPIVIDSEQFLKNPEQKLKALCLHFNIPYLTSMLKWPAGKRETDGSWAKYWYQNVELSTGFSSWVTRQYSLSSHQQRISDACRPCYDQLRKHCI